METKQENGVAAAAWPTSMPELDTAEQLVVWALRCSMLALDNRTNHHICLLRNELVRQFGPEDAQSACAGIFSIVRTVKANARRDLHFHQPCCPCLCEEELWLICLVGACQRGEARLAGFLAESTIQADGVGDVLNAAIFLAGLMRKHALVLPDRSYDARALGETPSVIH